MPDSCYGGRIAVGGSIMIRSSTIRVAAAAAFSLLSGAAVAQYVNVGVLECRGIGTTGFIIRSLHKFGLDIGITEQSVLGWGVLAPTGRIGPGDLAGTYAGVTAGAAVIVGAGANALIGGSNNTFALQPLSVEGQAGVNVTLGVASLELRYGP